MSVRIGHYEVVQSLGSGGMGEVFKAWDPRLKRHVAIKLLHRNLCRVDSAVRRFEREVRAMIALDHPNVVKVYDMHMGAKTSWFAMEFVGGADLARRLDSKEAFTWERCIHVVAQILDALSYVHGQGMLHRDVKPHNVLLDGRDEVRLMDFGLVKDGNGSDLTLAGQVLGSLRYLAPEVVDGRGFTAASDLYQVGLVTHCLLTGKLPFERAGTARELVKAIHGGLPPCPEQGLAGPIHPSLRRWLDKMVKLDPRKRFPDGPSAARALVEAGDSLLSSSSIALIRPVLEHSGERRPPSSSRRRPGWKVLLLLPLLLGGLALYGKLRGHRATPSLRDLKLHCEARSLHLQWRSPEKDPLVVVFGPASSKRRMERISSYSEGIHSCLLPDLTPKTNYSFHIRFPDGSTSLRRPFRTPQLRKLRLVKESRSAVGLRSLALSFESETPCSTQLRLRRKGQVATLAVSTEPRRHHRIVLRDLDPMERIEEVSVLLGKDDVVLAPIEGIILRCRKLAKDLRSLQGADRARRIFHDLEEGRAEDARAGLDAIRRSEAWERLEAFASAARPYFRSTGIPLAEKENLYQALVELEAVDAAFWCKNHSGGLDLARFYAPWVHLKVQRIFDEGTCLFDGLSKLTVLRPPDMPTTWAEGMVLDEMAKGDLGRIHQTMEELRLTVHVEKSTLDRCRNVTLAAALTNLDPAQCLHVEIDDRASVFLRHNKSSYPGLTTDSSKAKELLTAQDVADMAPAIVARLNPQLFHPGKNSLRFTVRSAPGLKGLGIRLHLVYLRLAFD